MASYRAAFTRPTRAATAAAAALLAAFAAPAAAQSFPFGLNLYATPAGISQDLSRGLHLAKDGSAVGATYYDPTDPAATRFGARITPSGMVNFSDAGSVFDISDGGAYTIDLRTRRSASGVVDQILPAATQFTSALNFRPQISGDGATMAGSTEIISSNFVVGSQAYRWTEQGGLQNLPNYRAGAIFTSVSAVSQDGSTIVGTGRTEFFGDNDAWTWTPQSGYTILPILPNASSAYARANAVNGDGSIIVGDVQSPGDGFWASVWHGNQLTTLPPLQGYRVSIAYDLSDDGSIITGVNNASAIGLPQIQTIWTEGTGWIPAFDYFRLQGVEIPEYLLAPGPVSVSSDGRTFVTEVFDTRTSEYIISVIVIPSPGTVPVIAVVFVSIRRARRFV
jgi:hypothetical protein